MRPRRPGSRSHDRWPLVGNLRSRCSLTPMSEYSGRETSVPCEYAAHPKVETTNMPKFDLEVDHWKASPLNRGGMSLREWFRWASGRQMQSSSFCRRLTDDDIHQALDAHRAWLLSAASPMNRKGQPADLSGVSLARMDLSGANLSHADLRHASLVAASLSHADLSHTDLRRAYLHEAKLAGANLRSARLTGADLTSADLTGVDLTGADLTGADLSRANLRGADFSGATLGDAVFNDATLNGATLLGAKCPEACVIEAQHPLGCYFDMDAATLNGWSNGDLRELLECGARLSEDLLARLAEQSAAGLALHFDQRVSRVERFMIDGVIIAVLGRDSDCEVTAFERRKASVVVRLEGADHGDLERVAEALWESAWLDASRSTESAAMALRDAFAVKLLEELNSLRAKLTSIELRQRSDAVIEHQEREAAQAQTKALTKVTRTWRTNSQRLVGAGWAAARKLLDSPTGGVISAAEAAKEELEDD